MKCFLVYNGEVHEYRTVEAAETGFYNLAEDSWHNSRTQQSVHEFIRLQRANVMVARGPEFVIVSQHKPFHGWQRIAS